ncbi:MAG: hypothetical protein KDD64_06825 [Bdellovibrionales bacterium]|nr:hypothetical protein [Bdellovibrionales bacterium]
MVQKRALFLVLGWMVTAPAFAVDPATASVDFCNCANPIYTELKSAMAAAMSGDPSGMQALQQSMQQRTQTLRTCMAGLKEKYQSKENDPDFKVAVEAEIEKRCPRPKFGPPAGVPAKR